MMVQKKQLFFKKYLVISKKDSTFAENMMVLL